MVTEEIIEKVFQGTFTAKIDNFSNINFHVLGEPSELTDCDVDNDFINISFIPEFYANGYSYDSEGYLSLFFDYPSECILTRLRYFETVMIIAVLDVNGNKRFQQSLSFKHNVEEEGLILPKFGLDKYMSRKYLLSDEPELVPDDTLTISVDIILLTHSIMGEDYSVEHIESTVTSTFKFVNFRYMLLLDSVVGNRLCENSSYFKTMSAVPMKENRTREMKISYEEYPVFKNIARIMLKAQYIEAHNIQDVCMLYVVADRYSIVTAVEICRRLFESRICDENVELINGLWHTYRDEYLEELVERFETDLDYRIKKNEANSRWVSIGSGRIEIQYELKLKEEKPELEFYQ